jgi:hypothetical protein
MEHIYSKVEPNKLLHVIKRISDFSEGREDLIHEDNFIQCSALNLPRGKTFIPHKHIVKNRSYKNQIAQESWVVIRGSVKCIFYDLDDQIITTSILHPGDASFTLYGGHNYEILEEGTLVYEYKTGPYEGQQFDKVFLK